MNDDGLDNKVHKDKVHKCDICLKVLSSASNLKQHKDSVHTNERPFSCEVCQRTFKSMKTKNTHKKMVHMTEKQFTCEVCQKKFKTKSARFRHQKDVHTNERPFKCKVCFAAFKTNSNIYNHIKNCHPDKGHVMDSSAIKALMVKESINKIDQKTQSNKTEYRCKICNHMFQTKKKLKKHKRYAHRSDSVDLISHSSNDILENKGSNGLVRMNTFTNDYMDKIKDGVDSIEESRAEYNQIPKDVKEKEDHVNDGYEATCSIM